MGRPRKDSTPGATANDRSKARKRLQSQARENLERKLLKAGDKAIPKDRVSPLTSDPISHEDFVKGLGPGIHVQAAKNEAAMMNRTYLAVDGMLASIASTSVALTERAGEVLATAKLAPLEITMMAESLARAANSCTTAMQTLMEMHRVHLRDPIRVLEAKAEDTDKPPTGDKARDFLAKLVKLPPPKPRVRAVVPLETTDAATTPAKGNGSKPR